LLEEKQLISEAMADLERAASHDESNLEILDALERVYRVSLEEKDEAPVRFRLVKLLLRRDDVDGAIEVAQKLVDHPVLGRRALRILGLCHWQKRMFYRAWQNFRELDATGEIKDILYRLAVDMESAEQLNNARHVLERLTAADGDFLDVRVRLERIQSRIASQREQLDMARRGDGVSALEDSRFVLLDEINRGSMGVVYRARDTILEEVVAVKVLNDFLCADLAAVERFKTEARAARKLTHPNIVRIHDFYESGSKKFISMEYIEGSDLRTILKEGRSFGVEQLIQVGCAVADALEYAHGRNVIHRDVKPANIMIRQNGEIVITDFGIAKVRQSGEKTATSSVVMGTPLYMAPEQIEGRGVDGRSDIYALGICLYEILAGDPPFVEGNVEYHHIYSQPPALPDSAHEDLAAIIMRAIEKNPEKRYQRASEMAEALNAFGESMSITAKGEEVGTSAGHGEPQQS
jgi:serine/threonine-protein kinase